VQFSLLGAVERLPRASKASDGGPGLSGGTILSWKQEQKAKNVTSNLPLLSILACVFLFV